MIVFELTMPNCGSWNGRWSQENKYHIVCKHQNRVPKELWNKDYYYNWDDGWTACVSVRQMPAADCKKLMRKSDGFLGYDWMIKSLIKDGYIHTME